jgi:hypothetical protein
MPVAVAALREQAVLLLAVLLPVVHVGVGVGVGVVVVVVVMVLGVLLGGAVSIALLTARGTSSC